MTFWAVLCWRECARYERGTREAGSHSRETIWVVGGVGRLVRLGVVSRHGANLPLLHILNLSLRVAQTVSKMYARGAANCQMRAQQERRCERVRQQERREESGWGG